MYDKIGCVERSNYVYVLKMMLNYELCLVPNVPRQRILLLSQKAHNHN